MKNINTFGASTITENVKAMMKQYCILLDIKDA
jgi:hypothetical protein